MHLATLYEMELIKIELIIQDKWNGYNFLLKYLEIVLVTLSSRTSQVLGSTLYLEEWTR